MHSATGHRWIEWEEAGDVTVARILVAKIRDDEAILGVFRQLEELMSQQGRYRTVLDFGSVVAMASYAIGKLLVLHNRHEAAGGRLALCCLGPVVTEILDILNLNSRLHIHTTELEALQSFA